MARTRNARKAAIALGAAAIAASALVLSRRTRNATDVGPAAPALPASAVVDGIPMAWEHHGGPLEERVPIVFVHGLPTNPRVWRYVMPRLASQEQSCLAWQLVGFGSSLRDGLGRDLSIPAQTRYLRAWLRHVGSEKAIFVGHDYGGGLVQNLLVTAPELFAGLVLVDRVAFDNWPVAAVRAAKAVRPAIAEMPKALLSVLFRGALMNLGHTNAKVAAESFRLFWRPYAEAGSECFAHQLRFFDNEDTIRIGGQLRASPCPAVVLWGELDPLGVSSARRLASAIDAELRILPGARHFSNEDHPDDIAAAVQDVIQKVG